MTAARVIVIGSINLDVLAHAPRLPRAGETVTGSSVAFLPGGKGANQAVAAARSGASVMMVGAVGSDSSAGTLLDFLKHEKLNTNLIKTASGPSGTALITVNGDGENTITIIPGANQQVDAATVDRLTFTASDIVLLQNEIPPATVRQAIEKAHRAGAATIYNPAPFRRVPDELLNQLSYLIVNEIEFAQLLETPYLNATERESNLKDYQKAKNIIVTLGSAGLIARLDNSIIRLKGHNVKAVDATGAGDCFCGAFAAALAEGQTPPTALAFANAAAALSVQHHGAGPSMPTQAEITHYLRQTS